MNIFLKAALFLFGIIQLTYGMRDSFFLKELKKKSQLSESINVANGWRPLLHEAISRYDTAALTYLLEQPGVRTDIADWRGMLPIHLAVENGDIDVVNCLLAHQVSPNVSDPAGIYPIHTAITRRDKSLLASLLEHNVDLEVQDKQGLRLLHWAIKTYKGKDAIELLMEHGANVNGKDANGNTPLQVALDDRNAKLGLIERLLVHGANPNIVNKDGATPLIIALRSHNIPMIKLLLAHNADPNKADANGNTPLQVALGDRNVKLELIESLLVHGANPNKDGTTSLIIALRLHNIPMIKLLLAHNADPNRADANGNTPLQVALGDRNVKPELIEILLAHGANPDIANANDPHEATPLILALGRQYSVLVIRKLIEYGADITIRDGDKIISKLLQDWHADENIVNASGNTLLHIAAYLGHTELIEPLINRGLDPNVQNDALETPLHAAARTSGKSKTIIELKRLGARLDIRNRMGERPFDSAVKFYIEKNRGYADPYVLQELKPVSLLGRALKSWSCIFTGDTKRPDETSVEVGISEYDVMNGTCLCVVDGRKCTDRSRFIQEMGSGDALQVSDRLLQDAFGEAGAQPTIHDQQLLLENRPHESASMEGASPVIQTMQPETSVPRYNAIFAGIRNCLSHMPFFDYAQPKKD